MVRMRSLIIMASFILLVATGALAQCPDLIASGCEGGTAWFGLRNDGANVAQGQTLTLPCDGAPLSVDFQVVVTGDANGGVPSMIAGDEIHVVLIDSDDLHVMSTMATVPADVFSGWLSFEFPSGMTVPAGVYSVVAYTTVERQCSFGFCWQQDTYDGGNRIASLDGIDGPWFDMSDDLPFRFFIDSNGVPTEVTSLSELKGQFR